ncbi:hypothetical protein Ddc_04919 [Ditylenchus destructor]|nr:hypothetical protein Ddc_04919 [Ditylenchus destructor]
MPMMIHHRVSSSLALPKSSTGNSQRASTSSGGLRSRSPASSLSSSVGKSSKAKSRKSAIRFMGSSAGNMDDSLLPPSGGSGLTHEPAFRSASKSVSFHDLVTSASIAIRSISPKRLLAASSSTLGIVGLAGSDTRGGDLCRLVSAVGSECGSSGSGNSSVYRTSMDLSRRGKTAVSQEELYTEEEPTGLRKSLSNYLIGCECFYNLNTYKFESHDI